MKFQKRKKSIDLLSMYKKRNPDKMRKTFFVFDIKATS